MSFLEEGLCPEEALAGYEFGGQVAGALRIGKGHINDTFAVYTQQPDDSYRRYILQRINTHVFTDPAKLMENIIGVTGHLRGVIKAEGGDPDRETLTVLPSRKGQPTFTASDGSIWRCYLFIENAVSYQRVDSPELFRAAANAFGQFIRQLEDYPAETLHETIPKFHDTKNRFENLMRAIGEDRMGRKKECAAEIEFAIGRKADCAVLTNLLEAGKLPLRVTHNDTKLNNIMMNPVRKTGVCVIDLDTVMPGLLLNDYGDAIRFGANEGGAEDEKDLANIRFSLPLFETYTAGYLETAGSAMTKLEKEMMPWGARLMTLECGIRFLTDYLEGDAYFKSGRPGQNLDRCRVQFKLVRNMEHSFEEMDNIVRRHAKLG